MKPKTTLIIILAIALFGVIFSGYLTYYNLFTSGCTEAIISCGQNPVIILGLPTCVYGLLMYLVVATLSIIALKKENKKPLLKAIMIIGIIGFLFAGSLSYYELFMNNTEFTELPACVYGFIMYTLILIFSTLGLRKKDSQIENQSPDNTINE